jgi:translation initiation factor 6
MMILSRFGGNPNIGVYSAAGEGISFVSPDTAEEYVADVRRALGVETVLTTVAGSFVVGSLMALNSNGAVISGLAEENEIRIISEHLPVFLLRGVNNAAGNNILANDNGAAVNPDLEDRTIAGIEKVLGVRCVRASVAGIKTIGAACKATNKGAVCHQDASDDEVSAISKILGVDVIRTTLNHGSRLLGPCLLANSKGAVVGDETTPIEMGRLEDALNLI